ncbi:MAG: SDR family oxidoreductase [Syntrophales bacterium]|jgi:nucleoside-diphosphate-sugar epimerase
MKVVITGALGHIGSRLIRQIPERFPGADIIMIDNLSTQRYCSLFNLPEGGNYFFHEADILAADLAPFLEDAEAVIHLAAITNAAGSFQIREQAEQVNFTGTERIARACLETGCPLMFLSTTSVYGTQKELVDESCSVEDLKPQSPYAESKLKAERLLEELGSREGLRFITLRFGTVFGTSIGMRFHTAVNKFCWQAVLGEPITVWRTALHQKRPYLDLEDAIRVIVFILENELFSGKLYNAVTTNATVDDVVQIIKRYVPDLSIQYVDTEIMNQLSYNVSSDRFRSLGFDFKGDMDSGIHQTIALLKGLQRGRL